MGARAILPGTAMFEACAAAAATLVDASRGGSRLSLQGVSIVAPLQLEQQGITAAAVVLECSMDAAKETLELTSVAPAAKRQQQRRSVHCRGTVATAQDVASAASPAARRWPAAAALQRQAAPQRNSSASATLCVAASGASAYFLHPAAADATLHLSAAANTPADSAVSSATKTVTRVPTGLACLVVPQAPVSGPLHPLARPEARLQPPRPDGSLRCSFRLTPPAPDATSAFQLCDLVVKEMAAAAPQPAAAAAAPQHQKAAAEPADVLYEIQWQAANSGGVQELISSPAAQQLLWQATRKTSAYSQAAGLGPQSVPAALSANFGGRASKLSAAAVEATMQGLELLQRTTSQLPASSSLRLRTRGAFQPLPVAGQQEAAAAAAGAAVAALAKVAANEYPAAGIGSLDMAPGASPSVVLDNSTKVIHSSILC